MSTEEEEYEVEVGRPTMPGTELRPFVSLELTAPPMASSTGFAEVAATPQQSPLAALESIMGTPLVSGKLAAVAGVLATALGAAAAWAPSLTFLPSWAPFVLWVLAGTAALLAGVPLPEFRGGFSVAQKAVPALAAVAAGIGTVASQLPAGSPEQGIVGFVGLVALALTGKAIPVKAQEDVRQ